MNQSINQPTNETNQSINQSINHSANQPTNQPSLQSITVADPGEGPGVFLDETEARRAEKFFLETEPLRRGSIPVSTFLRKTVRFYITDKFFKKKLSKLQGFFRGEWNWPIS